ncbi:MAG: flagellar hook-associated protein FlgK [Hyphomicrobiaceae bacterium]
MSLTTSWNISRSALATTAEHTALISRNIGNVGDPNASRKIASITPLDYGGVAIQGVNRATNASLFTSALGASSAVGYSETISGGLDRLDQVIGDPESDYSPVAMLGKLKSALEVYQANPHDNSAANSALSAAGDIVNTLNSANEVVQQVRRDADSEIADIVGNVNGLLERFEELNNKIISGTRIGADVTDELDARDEILFELSKEMGIKTETRSDNDMLILTESDVVVFERHPRSISFEKSPGLDGSITANGLMIDGVPVTGTDAVMKLETGRLVGLTTLRDDLSVTFQSQLDELARGLIETFAESDQSITPTQPDLPGLFTYTGATGVPASGTLIAGLAGLITLNPAADPALGGDINRIRDGGLADPGNPAYVYNNTGAAGFTDRLAELTQGFTEIRLFSAETGLETQTTIEGLAANTSGWLQAIRSNTQSELTYQSTVFQRASESLSNAVGINLDTEMAHLLELERSFQAASRLIGTIDEMFGALLAVT